MSTIIRRLSILTFVFAALGLSTLVSQGQQRDQLDEALNTWKEKFKELVSIQREFLICDENEADSIRKRWRAVKAEGDKMASQIVDNALAFYEGSNIDDAEITKFLTYSRRRFYNEGQYRRSALIGNALLQHQPDDFSLLFDTVKCAFFDNENKLALSLIENWKQRGGVIPKQLETLAEFVAMYQAEWERELTMRENDKDANLPRLELATPKGSIVIELFEDQAENSVNNFVHLVERDFYQNMTFFEVFDHRYALTGCPFNNGTGAPRVGVKSEAGLPDARKHFRGTVSLRVNPDDNTARSQFYLLTVPMPDFDGHNVVVGRVVEGMDIVDSLSATHKLDQKFNPIPVEDPVVDRLIGVSVRHKRDHEYVPTDLVR